jgi:cyclophilin family peptidyl-prolyl cis-trans isomerase
MPPSTFAMTSRRSLLAALALLVLASPSTPAAMAQESRELAMPAPAASTNGPRVLLQTNHGRIVIELYPDKAPRTVQNFLGYVQSGHYDGTLFHRVVRDLLIQGGAFTADLRLKNERVPVASEANNGLSNLRGTVAAARRIGEKDSATSQFFINTVDNPQLDHVSDASPYTSGHAVFGHVVEGMDVVDKIRVVPTTTRAPLPGDVPVKPVLVERAQLLED